MADVIRSRNYEPEKLRHQLLGVVARCNAELRVDILSPYTVTLGDEFQGIATSARGMLEAVQYFERSRLKGEIDFKLRYVCHQGAIETAINFESAHQMLGPGLTAARAALNQKGKNRFQFLMLDQNLSRSLTMLGTVRDGIETRWPEKDRRLVYQLLINDSDKEVAEQFKKNRSQIWKRREHLLTSEYSSIFEVMSMLIQRAEIGGVV